MKAPCSPKTGENSWVGRIGRSRVQAVFLALAGLLGFYLCCRMVIPFFSSLVWALALAVALTPIHRRLELAIRRPNPAALIMVLGALLIFAVPSVVLGRRLTQEAEKGAELVQARIESGDWRRSLEAHPRMVGLADLMERQNMPSAVKSVAVWMTGAGRAFLKGSLLEIWGFLLTFYVLFFFLRDRAAGLAMLRKYLPLPAAMTTRLLGRVENTVFAMVYGTLFVAGVQGALGGLMFWWLGLPAPWLWGVVMALLAVVPVLGAFIVWLPAVVYLGLDGSPGRAIILGLWGMLVVGGIDNLLRPFLVGGRVRLHTLLLFISIVGGVVCFGASGLIAGPVILVVTSELLETWAGRGGLQPAALKDDGIAR